MELKKIQLHFTQSKFFIVCPVTYVWKVSRFIAELKLSSFNLCYSQYMQKLLFPSQCPSPLPNAAECSVLHCWMLTNSTVPSPCNTNGKAFFAICQICICKAISDKVHAQCAQCVKAEGRKETEEE